MYAVIPQDYDLRTDCCQTHKVRRCTLSPKPVGESVKAWYTDDSGTRRYELVDPIYQVFSTRLAAELAAASATANSPYGQMFHGRRNWEDLQSAHMLCEQYPVGPGRAAIFEAGHA